MRNALGRRAGRSSLVEPPCRCPHERKAVTRPFCSLITSFANSKTATCAAREESSRYFTQPDARLATPGWQALLKPEEPAWSHLAPSQSSGSDDVHHRQDDPALSSPCPRRQRTVWVQTRFADRRATRHRHARTRARGGGCRAPAPRAAPRPPRFWPPRETRV